MRVDNNGYEPANPMPLNIEIGLSAEQAGFRQGNNSKSF